MLPILESTPARRLDRERISSADTLSIAPRILTLPPMVEVVVVSVADPVARKVSEALVGLAVPLIEPLTLTP